MTNELDEYMNKNHARSGTQGWCRTKDLKTLAEYWDALVDTTYHNWLVSLAARLAPSEARMRCVDDLIAYTIQQTKAEYDNPEWHRWADAWITGADRSEAAARAATHVISATTETRQAPGAFSAWTVTRAAAAWPVEREVIDIMDRHGVPATLLWALTMAQNAQTFDKEAALKHMADFWRKEPNPFKGPAGAQEPAEGRYVI